MTAQRSRSNSAEGRPRDVGAVRVVVRGDLDIELTRTFRAPRQLVYDAHVRPEYVRRWWGPHGATMVTCEMDVRVGGRWHFVVRAQDGKSSSFAGEYREIVPPERLVYTFAFLGSTGRPSTETLTFSERDGTTTIVARSVFESRQQRDDVAASGMTKGAAETWDRLAAVVEEPS